jgi:hypothetical protein
MRAEMLPCGDCDYCRLDGKVAKCRRTSAPFAPVDLAKDGCFEGRGDAGVRKVVIPAEKPKSKSSKK